MSFHAPVRGDTPASRTQSLGRWLLAQRHRTDAIGELAEGARRDPRFPADGDYAAISKRLNELGADGDVHAALEDAELDWAAH